MLTKRARLWLRRGGSIALVVAVLVVVLGTWFTSQQIKRDLLEVEPIALEYDVGVLALGDAWIALENTPESAAPGVWGLEWESGYARVGQVLAITDDRVDRELLGSRGNLAAGTSVGVDAFAYESDPADAGLEFDEALFGGPLGQYPAWQVDGADDTWVIFVHDRGSYRREALRLLPAVAQLGFPSLVVTYRNDPPAPESPNNQYSLGRHEWLDVEAAIEHAVAGGARDVVLVGYGMGGGIVTTLVRESEWAPRVQALVLDAPLLEPGAVVDDDAAAKDVPGFIVGMAKGLVGLRFGVDWGRLDQIRHAAEFELPILLFHGDADDQVPIRTSGDFAAAAPEIVQYHPIAGAGHVRSWNIDPLRYEATVQAFLIETAAGPSDLDPVDEDLLDGLIDPDPGEGGSA